MLNLKIEVRESTCLRLDQYLANLKIAPSRAQVALWIRKGCILLNQLKVKPSIHLKLGDQIEVQKPESRPWILKPEKIPLDVFYEDEDLLLLNKNSSMVVHPGAGNRQGTLVQALLAHCGKLSLIGGIERPGLVHRLDKGTSGAMVIAKNDAAHVDLSEQFKNHRVRKIYWALVYGKMKDKQGTISTLLVRSPTHRKKMAVNTTRGKKAITHYKLLKEASGFSFVEVRLETGRTHQIRVHLTHAGYPVVGDPLYGGHAKRVAPIKNIFLKNALRALTHPLLHAHSLEFCHPGTKEMVKWTAPLPEDFDQILNLVF